MQIKRFEADDMTEALRLVKREFGDDAVILSAKEVRTKGFFSALRKRRVEINAAADYPPDASSESQGFTDMLSSQLDRESPVDQVCLSNRAQSVRRIHPVPQTGRADADSTRHSRPVPSPGSGNTGQQLGHGIPAGINRTAADHSARRGATAPSGEKDPSTIKAHQAMPCSQWIAKPFYKTSSGRRQVIALVGPSGTGKTAAVAKLARFCRVEENLAVALISLDRFRIGANALLERVARAMDLPFAVVHDADQLHARLDDFDDADIVLMDTPGVNAADRSLMAQMNALVGESGADEVHLVVNATVRERLLIDLADRFAPFGIDRLLFTHMDEYERDNAIADILSRTRLPVSFYTDGTDMFDHLHEFNRACLGGFLSIDDDSRQRVTPFRRHHVQSGEGHTIAAGAADQFEVQYVANRNSELFHVPSCKSVKRINVENITAFESAEQAMDAGFKPCRACCRASAAGHAKKVAWAAS